MATSEVTHDRWSKRRELEVDVVIHDGKHQPMRGLMINISIGGAYIEMGAPQPEREAAISLDFKTEIDGEPQYYHMPAKVAHVDETGIGLVFEDYDADTVEALKRLMRSVLGQ
ncbi:MAG: PilZ domain-containing protein [Proteobacteria bacterium]|nr:PilZ domain-containing protein [Pseudomonadota bacterium]